MLRKVARPAGGKEAADPEPDHQHKRKVAEAQQVGCPPFDDFRPRHNQVVEEPPVEPQPIGIEERGQHGGPGHQAEASGQAVRLAAAVGIDLERPQAQVGEIDAEARPETPPCVLVQTTIKSGASHKCRIRSLEY